jgi:peptidylprolyl isomerase
MLKYAPQLTVIIIVLIALGGIIWVINSGPKVSSSNPDQNPFPSVSFSQDAKTQQNVIITPSVAQQQPITQDFSNMTTLEDGLKYEDIATGSGKEVKSGDTVTVNYLGTLLNGQKFDSSYDRNQPFSTQIGVGQVIKGWDQGIVGMKVGGKRKLVIPPDLGYGDQAAGSIPPGSTLVFEVELMAVKSN